MASPPPIHGRGSADNPATRFIPLHYVRDDSPLDDDDPAPSTRFYHDASRSILSANDSPDIPFTFSVNPYRGCEHGCIYCYARPTHEYLSFSAGLDFETRILVKDDAPELLRRELDSPKWEPQPISFSGVTDCYQPVERRLQLTRRCLEVFRDFRNPVGIVTKNHLVTRDVDVLRPLAEVQAAVVLISITTLDLELARVMEPRASIPTARLRAIEQLTAAGIPTGVMVAPVIPGLTDHEMPNILKAARDAGAVAAAYVMLRLPSVVAQLFEQWLEQHFPERKEKVLGRIRELRGGELNDSNFGTRMTGVGMWADLFRNLFRVSKKKHGYPEGFPPLNCGAFQRRRPVQRFLFDTE
ncbi:PA0069 family radical SAM protein [Tuwongella immobilis]|uniref:Elp3/MiaA/NifB-like radical SAM core domain-containing protein n=1 Tax=Tuwongella immobilis TaxID=692036 RepID=A0A6C2YYA9_9BACT|nr:PA0069 family radical SAM protein [Tuwongella immobilis]VIP05762.1 radical sam protein : Radical SAM domain protein OS=Pedosphaera parvula (strain Ellin514) GN=Cflav_PD2874 PE=4 SV=1: Radical_SAM [Tuwongella immobilis]VTS08880.1 radical sam protein : Radical SAM domain protein OS=Pedosphaera parvula (strain Ellin514) GN=Cflav_PD2874 PE=4 SV=1: Radical_SAM [Tuwongella immobilis]